MFRVLDFITYCLCADSLHSYESSLDHVELSDEFITDNLIVNLQI